MSVYIVYSSLVSIELVTLTASWSLSLTFWSLTLWYSPTSVKRWHQGLEIVHLTSGRSVRWTLWAEHTSGDFDVGVGTTDSHLSWNLLPLPTSFRFECLVLVRQMANCPWFSIWIDNETIFVHSWRRSQFCTPPATATGEMARRQG
jgi:hypothetical protein